MAIKKQIQTGKKPFVRINVKVLTTFPMVLINGEQIYILSDLSKRISQKKLSNNDVIEIFDFNKENEIYYITRYIVI